ncbi:MAG TPA: M56 family metallopeptidase [Phenylobacterium sp.]|jgi:beta-lactamase regulating signal transducer with metallopeptidase domain|nr:M56 family metallopeptidase [Phenylobacterium sp.]
MTVTLTYLQSLIPALGWTLANFLWQGALVALVLQVVLKACRTARARHDWALAALVVMAIIPVATFAWLQTGVRIVLVPRGFPGLIPAGQRWETLAVAAWLFGVAALAVRMAGGLVLVERLRRTATALPFDWVERCRRLEQRIAAPLHVLFAQSEAVATPIVAGWLKPMVLIPAGFLTRLAPAELEALILHELAHVRRLDAFANLVQSVVETILFYHPAVWWVSRCVRLERERCCDDMAVAAVRDPALYVRALQSIEALRAPSYGVLAANGGHLKSRAARILGLASAPERPALSRTAAILILTAAAAAMTHSAAVQAKPDRTNRPAPAVRDAATALATATATAHATPTPTASVSARAAEPVQRAPRIVLAEAAPLPAPPLPVTPSPLQVAEAPPSLAPIRLALAAAPPAQTLSPLIVQPPSLPSKPDVNIEISGNGDHAGGYQVWPRNAFTHGFDGHVTLGCKVDVHGLAERCEVLSESPQGHHFGTAALELRPTLKLTPARGPDGPIESIMSIAITFKQPLVVCADEQSATSSALGAEKSISSMSGGGASAGSGGSSSNCVGGHVALSHDTAALESPAWTAAPSFDELARAYPAKGGGVEGYAAAHCHVERDGSLGACFVIKEAPEKSGFGAAALTLTGKFRVDPKLVAPYVRTKIWVDVPIRFMPPGAIDRTVAAPMWVADVDARQRPDIFLPAAVEKGLTSGHGVARCTVATDGTLSACVADPETADGLGFSEAAARLASSLRMSLWSEDAAPVAGGVVHVPIQFRLKGAEG